jgi:5-formyltetrahydrofolate cyclo-ligase
MSVSVRDRLWVLPTFQDAKLVLAYVSAKDNEVDSHEIITRLLEEGRHVACPAIAPDNRLVWRRIESLGCLVPGQYGIPVPDPERCRVVTPDPSCVVLVPGIAFARDGHRIGYGCGYFDRFLRDFPCASLGLAYDFQVIDPLPHGPHDIRVDFVLTESMTYAAAKQA